MNAIIFITLVIVFAAIVFGFSKRTENNTLSQAEQKPAPICTNEDTSTAEAEKPKPMTRKNHFQYYYMSKAGNVYPSTEKGHFYPNDTFEFTIAGTNLNDDIADYMGEFRGRLVPDPLNEHDPNAIRVEHEDGGLIGYVPRNVQQQLREFKGELPCPCYCFVEFKSDKEFYFLGHCYVVSKEFGEL